MDSDKVLEVILKKVEKKYEYIQSLQCRTFSNHTIFEVDHALKNIE